MVVVLIIGLNTPLSDNEKNRINSIRNILVSAFIEIAIGIGFEIG